jgi:LuxR family maltose regulon positive regulatory protein
MAEIQTKVTQHHHIPLLYTKLHIPRVRSDLVSRPRLTQRLEDGLGRKLTLISAPAGSGKTTLVVEWSQAYKRPIAWISLDPGDNDPIRFLTYLITALNTLQANIGQEPLKLLSASQLPGVEAILSVLINDLINSRRRLILVLDDYQVIEEPKIHAGLTFLLDHQPQQLHLILTSRADPPLPLARMRSRGLVTEFHAEDLRFIPDEVVTFLNTGMDLNLSVEAIARLEARTEGWIAALQFAALSLRNITDPAERQRFIQVLSGRDRHLVDYLVEEVLQHQPASVQAFLLQTSILGRLCGPLCDAVLKWGVGGLGGWGRSLSSQTPAPPTSGQEMLEYLERANLFIIPLDNERRWYRYHHLFADLLHHRLQRTLVIAELAALHRRASHWFEAQALIDEAIDHALAAEDFDRAARLVGTITNKALWEWGAMSRLRHWLSLLPSDILYHHPQLGLAGAISSAMTHDLAGAQNYMQILAQIPDLSSEILAGLKALQANWLRIEDNVPQAIDLLRQALAQLPGDNLIAQIQVKSQLGWALLMQEDLTASEQIMKEVVDMARAIENTGYLIYTQGTLGDIAWSRGQLKQAAKIYQEILQFAANRDGPVNPACGQIYINLGDLFYEWNDFSLAAEHYSKGLALGEQAGIGDIILNGYRAQAFLWQRQGDITNALQRLHRIKQRIQAFNHIPLIADRIACIEADLALRRDDLAEVSQWVAMTDLSLNDKPDSLRHEYGYAILIQFFLAWGQGRSEPHLLYQASSLLERLIELAESKEYINAAIFFNTLQALVYQALNKLNWALTILERALSLAEPSGYIRNFLDRGPAMAILLRQARKQGIMPDYTSKLLAAFQAEVQTSRDTTGHRQLIPPLNSDASAIPVLEPLTERELDVLKQMAIGLSNQQIADKLVISINTVRTHLKNVYSKLNTRSRVQAIAIARQLGIL